MKKSEAITDLCGLMRAKNSFVSEALCPLLICPKSGNWTQPRVSWEGREEKLGNRLALPRLFSKATL